MTNCSDCGRDMLAAGSCTIDKFTLADGSLFPRIRYGSEKPSWRGPRCGDCGVGRGGYHHPGCDIEQCPACFQQFISCGCFSDSSLPSQTVDGPPWVDVETAIEITSDLMLGDPEMDLVYIDPVAICGHVARGPVRAMVRGEDLPLDEWFDVGSPMDGTAALLFIGRSLDFGRVDDDDLDVGRRLAAYATDHDTLPWDFVFVTERGNFKVSHLLGLPGHPPFEPCIYRRHA